MKYDGTPVLWHENRRVQLQKRVSYIEGGGMGVGDQPEEKEPVDGIVQFDIPIGPQAVSVELTVCIVLNCIITVVTTLSQWFGQTVQTQIRLLLQEGLH